LIEGVSKLLSQVSVNIASPNHDNFIKILKTPEYGFRESAEIPSIMEMNQKTFNIER